MSVRVKLFGIMTFFVVVLLAIGAGGGYIIYRTGTSAGEILNRNALITEQVGAIDEELAGMKQNEKELFVLSETQDINKRTEYHKKVLAGFGNIRSAMDKLKSAGIRHNNSQDINEIEASLDKAETSFKRVAFQIDQGINSGDIHSAYLSYRPHIDHFMENMATFRKSVLLEAGNTGSAISDSQKQNFTVFLVIVLPLVLLGGVMGFLHVRQITDSLHNVMAGVTAMSKGKGAELPVSSSDEFGEMSRALNETMVKLKAYMRAEEENKRNQENVIKFLDVVSTAAEGDFTKKAPVTTDVFGSLADAFNMMTEELSSLIKDARSTAEEFERDSVQTLDLLKEMADGSETQMVQLRNATEAVDETAQATLEISEKTQEATALSIKAAEVSQKGERLVARSIEGMQTIRGAVQTINKKMKMFSERIIEIASISGMIAEISSRTNLLSMNASIEAARAGDAGKGFVVIAEEIRNLADKSAQATRDITDIIRYIQTEAGEITSSLEEETEIVERQSDMAAETKSSFTEIRSSVDQSKSIVAEILPLSLKQRKMTNDVVLSMENVNRISLELLGLVQESERISGKLSGSSKELLASVDKFKLPEAAEPGTEASKTDQIKTVDMKADEYEHLEFVSDDMEVGKEAQ